MRNMTVADNHEAGIELEWILLGAEHKDVCRVEDSVVIGSSNGNPGSATHGIVAPKSDLWFVTNVRFYNFFDGAAALGDCSACETPDTDSGARTTRFSNLYFDASVGKRIAWRWPFKGIFHDLDGTLTEQGENSYVGAYWKHNVWPECTVDMAVYDGIICPAPYAIERVVFHHVTGNADKDTLYAWQYDPDQVEDMTEEEKSHYLVADNGSEIGFIVYQNPFMHNTGIYVTQHRYYLRWQWGLDFETQDIQIIGHLWEKPEDSVQMVMPYYETREAIDMTSQVGGLQPNGTLVSTHRDNWVLGSNVVYDDVDVREMHWAVNARDGSNDLHMKGWRCKDACDLEPVDDEDPQDTVKLWSDERTWPALGRVPIAGDEAEIPDGWEVIYDVGTSPVLKSVEVNGKLSFERGQSAQLNTYSLWVRAGQVDIGTPDEPFDGDVEIVLHGNVESESQFVFTQSVPVGNKNLIVTGTLNMYGTPRARMTRLLDSAMPGQSTLLVATGLDY